MEGRFSSFTVLIAKISREIRRIKTEEMAELSLKSPHVSCLYYLYTQGSMTVRELCDICDEDKAAISRSLEYLEECGYIVRDHADGRRYKAPLVLTEGGREIAERVTEKIERVLFLPGNVAVNVMALVILLCLALLVLFTGDVIYSRYVPNMGEGITDFRPPSAD